MKKLVLAIFTVVFFAIPCFSQKVAEGVPVTKEGHEIFATITKWADAVRSRDTKALDALFDEDLIVTAADGKTRGKTEELDALKPSPDVRVVSIINDDVKVRLFGQSAVATGLNRMRIVSGGKDVNFAFRYTAVFINKAERWQLAALHISQLK